MNRLSKNHFWQWFAKHNNEYLQLARKSKKEYKYWINELNAHLRAYYKFLEFTLSVDPDYKSATLTLTVNGRGIYFRRVDEMVAKAPSIPGWTIKALEDPFPIDFMLEKEIAATGVDPRELVFAPVNDRQPVGITVYHPLYREEKKYPFVVLATEAVYNLLGERSFGTDIRDIEVANLSSADPEEVYKLEDLPDYIGSQKSSIMVDGNGLMWGMK